MEDLDNENELEELEELEELSALAELGVTLEPYDLQEAMAEEGFQEIEE